MVPLATLDPGTLPGDDMSNLDPREAALSRYTSAHYELEHAASQYAELAFDDLRRHFVSYCKEAEEHDPADLVHEFTDGLQEVIYTHRATALVIGCNGRDEVQHDYQQEYGADEVPSIEQLAYFLIAQELYEVARELEEGGAA